MSISPQWLDELRARITLSSVVGRTTRLTKAGREFKACCPFHNEKSPSFYVNDEKGFYHCFGCGAHGDAIRWLTDQRGMGFLDAVKELAAEAGMEVPAPDPRAARQAEQMSGLHAVTEAAQAWFAAQLDSDEGRRARDYLARRGLDAHTIARFGFGYAPEGRQALKAGLAQFPESQLIDAGLRITVEGKEPYDRFRGRVMLPIHDARGRVIAFGGRILDSAKTDAPKYLNSPDTPLFDKGRTLYNLHRAGPLSRQSGRMLVVEGYMDVVALSAAGIGECVAPLGTALTERQIEMLWRMVEVPVLCFDGDAAGQRAAMRAVARALPLLRPAHSLRIVRLPAGLDPDDLIRQQGAAAMERLLGEAKSLLDTLWEHERDAIPLSGPEDKAGLKARLLAHVETIGDADIKALYRRELMDRFSEFAFPSREASAGFARPAPRGNGFGRVASPAPAQPSPEARRQRARAASAPVSEGLTSAVIVGLARMPAEIARNLEALSRLARDDARFDALVTIAEQGGPLETAHIVARLAERGFALPRADRNSRLAYPFVSDKVEAGEAVASLRGAIAVLVEGPILQQAIDAATANFDVDEQKRLRERRENLLKGMRGVAS